MDRNDEKSRAGKEPQSYGSQEEWLRGRTGQTVNETPHTAERHDEAFYEDRRDSEMSESPQGGLTSSEQKRESAGRDVATTEVVRGSSHNVTGDSDERKSYFKARDYS
jgi:hypothetical protein